MQQIDSLTGTKCAGKTGIWASTQAKHDQKLMTGLLGAKNSLLSQLYDNTDHVQLDEEEVKMSKKHLHKSLSIQQDRTFEVEQLNQLVAQKENQIAELNK